MSQRTKKGILVAVVLWIVIIGGIAATVKYILLPRFQDKKKTTLANLTSSESKYKYNVNIAADNFSGYCILRSPELKERLSRQGVKLSMANDGADYKKRLKDLSRGNVDVAVFPINSLIQCGAEMDEFPATIVYIIDETRGADAIIALQSALAKIGDLNTPKARIVLTPDSPSEFMARVLIASFNLPEFPEDDWMIEKDGSAEVYKCFRADSSGKPYAYAMWEPDVSKALNDKNAHILLDSSKLKGYIVDALVVRREFLVENYNAVKIFLEEYARTAYENQNKMVDMVLNDSKITGSPVSRKEAEQTVKGIEWKNTLENYAYFGLKNVNSFENIEDIILKITNVLIKTGSIKRDPLEGKTSSLFYNKILKDMMNSKFHPGKDINVISGMDTGRSEEKVRGAQKLGKLTARQWSSLVEVGELRIKPINFGRGTARINIKSARDLKELSTVLKSWPNYYLTVTGKVRSGGNEIEALKLAKARADAAVNTLVNENGIDPARIRSFAKIAETDSVSGQSVSFVVSQFPY